MEIDKIKIKKSLLILIYIVIIIVLLNNSSSILSFFNKALAVLSPFVIGLILAFVLNILLNPLERLWGKIHILSSNRILKKFKRPVCLLLSIIILLSLITFILFMIVPEFKSTFTFVVNHLPTYLDQLQTKYDQLAEFLAAQNIHTTQLNIEEIGTKISTFVSSRGSAFFSTTIGVTTSLFSGLFSTILGIVFSIYVLAQKEKLLSQFSRLLKAFLSDKNYVSFTKLCTLINSTFYRFVTGQLIEACIIGSLCGIGMLIFSIPYALTISVLVGFTALIPVYGAFFGTAIGAFLILMVDPIKAFWFVLFIIILQQMENNLIYPKVVGRSVGLPGIWVFFVVTLAGSMFGVLGMLFSVPTASIVYTLVKQKTKRRLAKSE